MKAKPNNFPAEEEEKHSNTAVTGKGELASLYLPQHHTAKRRRALQRMDRRRPGTQRAAVGHRHESTEQAIYPRTGTAHRRSTRRTLVSKYSKNLRTAPSLEASKSCHRRCSGHVAPAGRQGREILRKGDTAR